MRAREARGGTLSRERRRRTLASEVVARGAVLSHMPRLSKRVSHPSRNTVSTDLPNRDCRTTYTAVRRRGPSNTETPAQASKRHNCVVCQVSRSVDSKHHHRVYICYAMRVVYSVAAPVRVVVGVAAPPSILIVHCSAEPQVVRAVRAVRARHWRL